MDILSQPLTVLTVAAGLALGVERALEVVKQALESHSPVSRPAILDHVNDTTARAIKTARIALDGIHSTETATRPVAAPTGPEADEPESADLTTEPIALMKDVVVLPATRRPLEYTRRIAFYQLFSAGLGIILAGLFEVQLFHTFFANIRPDLATTLAALPWVDHILTGIVIGGGSQPVHLLIQFLTRRRTGTAPAQPSTTVQGEK